MDSPRRSAARDEFLDAFAADVAAALGDVDLQDVDAEGLAPSPELDWMSVVSFRLFPERARETREDADARRRLRDTALTRLAALVRDASSELFQGDVACFVDPSCSEGLRPSADDGEPASSLEKRSTPMSPDPAVAALLKRYGAASDDAESPTFVVRLSRGTARGSFTTPSRCVRVCARRRERTWFWTARNFGEIRVRTDPADIPAGTRRRDAATFRGDASRRRRGRDGSVETRRGDPAAWIFRARI